MKSELLFLKTNYTVFVPNLRFFINKLANKENFAIIKYSVELWMMIDGAIKNMGIPISQISYEFLSSDENLKKLAKEISKYWETKRRGVRPWKSNDDAVYRVLKGITEKHTDNFMFGISSRCLTTSNIGANNYQIRDILLRIMHVSGQTGYSSFIWRDWASSGKINNLIEAFNFMPKLKVVIVGAYYFNNFGQKLKLNNYDHICIHQNEALLHLKETKQEILIKHNQYLKNNDFVLYMLVGGTAAMWLILELYRELPSASMIDIGRALDVYYYYDKIKKFTPTYMWGHWLTKSPPKWVKSILTVNKNGVFCKK